MCRWRPASAPRVRTGTTTSSCARTETWLLPVGEERLQPSAPLPSGDWSPRVRPRPSMTPWWPAPPRARPAQTRAPPTARTLTSPLLTQATCEWAKSANHSSRCSSLNLCRIPFIGWDLKKEKTDMGLEAGICSFWRSSAGSCRQKRNCTFERWHFQSWIPSTLSLYLSSVPLQPCLSWCCMLCHLPNARLLDVLGPVTRDI